MSCNLLDCSAAKIIQFYLSHIELNPTDADALKTKQKTTISPSLNVHHGKFAYENV